eukprot:SAG31_NODE_27025_length_433_cov_1.021021_2_plen_73_part_01
MALRGLGSQGALGFEGPGARAREEVGARRRAEMGNQLAHAAQTTQSQFQVCCCGDLLPAAGGGEGKGREGKGR